MDAKIVTAGFDLFIRTRYKDQPALLAFTLTHQRRHLAEENVLREARICAKLPRMRFDKRKLEMMIAAGASIFCDLAKAAKERELMTAAELKRHETAAGAIADTERFVADMDKEYQRSLVAKTFAAPKTRFENAEASSIDAGGELADGGSDGPAPQSTRRDPDVPGTDGEPVSPSSPCNS